MKRITYDVIRSRDSATFTGSYQTLGSPLSFACSIIKFVNNSNQLVTISTDGTNTHDVLPANSYSVYDETTNHSTEYTYMAKGTQFYILGASGTGLVYLVTQYTAHEGV